MAMQAASNHSFDTRRKRPRCGERSNCRGIGAEPRELSSRAERPRATTWRFAAWPIGAETGNHIISVRGRAQSSARYAGGGGARGVRSGRCSPVEQHDSPRAGWLHPRENVAKRSSLFDDTLLVSVHAGNTRSASFQTKRKIDDTLSARGVTLHCERRGRRWGRALSMSRTLGSI